MSVDEQQRVTLEFLKKVADRFGYVLNPNDEALNRVAQSMTEIRVEHGKNYCPCKRHYPLDKEADPLCPCETFKDEIAQNGHCECHIFFDADAAEKFKRRSGLLATVTCPGWASKVSRAQLALALSGFPQAKDERVLVGNETGDDAGVVRIAPDRALVHTVDLLAPVVDDPYTFGRIAAVNSLSDIYAMGGTPLAAMNVIGFPDNLSPEIMGEILHGGQDEVVKAGAVMLGGHTFQDAEIRYGLALTGEISPDEIYTNSGSKPGDVLVLTKPLGTGTIIQAMMTRGVISEELYRSVAESMVTSNRSASELVREHEANACTDITGFGFIGHLWEMADAAKMGVNVWVDRLPVFPNVLDLIRDGVTDAGVKMNMNSFEDKVSFDGDVAPEYSGLLYASETSGGLLIAVSENKASALVDDLHDCGLEAAAVVGEVTTENPGRIRVCR